MTDANMAAGRGQGCRSLPDGLERNAAPPVCTGREPGRRRGAAAQRELAAGGRRKRRSPRAAPSPAGAALCSLTPTKAETTRRDVTLDSPMDNFLERLPWEVLMKILSYLDASSLVCVGLVSRLLHQLADDPAVWQSLYASAFGGDAWRPRSAEAERSPARHWKRLYFLAVGGPELRSWRAELKHVSASTGLPHHTSRFLRTMKVSWELTVREASGRETRAEPSHAHFSESALMLSWSATFPKYGSITRIQLHGVRRQLHGRPGWRSLILQQDVRSGSQSLGKDRSVRVLLLSPGFVVGVWRGESSVAFIMVSLHLHMLVERSLLGSLVWRYCQPGGGGGGGWLPALAWRSDPELGLHGYTLHFSLHSSITEVMTATFCPLSCSPGGARRGLLELSAIHSRQLSQHRPLAGNICLHWRSDPLEGSVQKCCFMTLTLLDQFHKAFWCVSSPVCMWRAKHRQMADYSGEDFLMKYQDLDGEVRLALVWLEEQQQFFLISLLLYVSVDKVNKHFCTKYVS